MRALTNACRRRVQSQARLKRNVARFAPPPGLAVFSLRKFFEIRTSEGAGSGRIQFKTLPGQKRGLPLTIFSPSRSLTPVADEPRNEFPVGRR